MKPTNRSVRVNELIKRELATILCSPNERYARHFLTVTSVQTSRDLRYADVWISVYGDVSQKRDVVKQVQDSARHLRFQLTQRLKLRRVPELRFDLDETLDNAERIDTILRNEGLLDEPTPSSKPDDD